MIDRHLCFVIARRELTRVTARFQGGSRPLVVLLLLAAIGLSYMAYRQGATVNHGVYRVGVSPNGPIVDDGRFVVKVLELESGMARLQSGAIDAYIDGGRVVARADDRSQYAVGALKRYLERQELIRIANANEAERAFPLRVELNYMPTVPSEDGALPQLSLVDMLEARPPDVGPADSAPSAVSQSADSGDFVRQQVDGGHGAGGLPELELSGEDILIPSLSEPPIPFTQVVIAFFYVLPIAFISIFFTSSFMDEKLDQRITVLLSAPIRPLEVIIGKMLPYFTFAVLSVIAITLVLAGNVLLALAIFLPVILFIFAIYLMVPLIYRTFRDTTFISMLAVTLITAYLIFPAMFTGVNDFSYLSPLTLAVQMYREQPFGLREYLFSAVPMTAIFAFALYVGSRVLNEEFLMGFRPIGRKLAEAVYLSLNRNRPYLSILFLSLLFIPIVYLLQLVVLAVSLNLPFRLALVALLFASIVVEEIAKSIGVVVLYQRSHIRPLPTILGLAFVSAVGFLIGEKALLFLSLSVVSESALSTALFSTGFLLIPLAAHFVFTSLVCLLNGRLHVRYSLAILAAATAHAAYNLTILGTAL